MQFLILLPFTGTRVTQVSATDNEDDAITYEIGSDADGKFSIDSTTGWITSNVIIDREVFIHYSRNESSHGIVNRGDWLERI